MNDTKSITINAKIHFQSDFLRGLSKKTLSISERKIIANAAKINIITS